jgi:guanylate kinase
LKKGILIILSGPSGVGKGTVRQFLMKDKELNLAFSVSMTTRAPRAGEVNGKDYFFVSKDEFKKALENDELLEHATFVDNSYGTPKKYVDSLLQEGRNVLLEIDTNGALQVMKNSRDDYVSIFLTCDSLEELEKRIRGRKSESEKVILERLEKAKKEILLEKFYQYVVLNDVPSRAADEIIQIIKNKIAKA